SRQSSPIPCLLESTTGEFRLGPHGVWLPLIDTALSGALQTVPENLWIAPHRAELSRIEKQREALGTDSQALRHTGAVRLQASCKAFSASAYHRAARSSVNRMTGSRTTFLKPRPPRRAPFAPWRHVPPFRQALGGMHCSTPGKQTFHPMP